MVHAGLGGTEAQLESQHNDAALIHSVAINYQPAANNTVFGPRYCTVAAHPTLFRVES